MTTHEQARQCARIAIVNAFGVASEGEVKALAGVACLETSYGDGWKGSGVGSFNLGAIQCGKGWAGERFSYVDTHPNADGTSTRYQVDFRKYPTREAGWADLVQVVFVNCNRRVVRSAAQQNDWYGVSKAMRQTGFYEGFGRNQEERISNHFRALSGAIARADKAAVPVVVVPSLPPTVRRGDIGEAVKLLQGELGIARDGIFGPVTGSFLQNKQSALGLKSDGICGPLTWAALFSDDYRPEAA
jgi:hypothetical protein